MKSDEVNYVLEKRFISAVVDIKKLKLPEFTEKLVVNRMQILLTQIQQNLSLPSTPWLDSKAEQAGAEEI